MVRSAIVVLDQIQLPAAGGIRIGCGSAIDLIIQALVIDDKIAALSDHADGLGSLIGNLVEISPAIACRIVFGDINLFIDILADIGEIERAIDAGKGWRIGACHARWQHDPRPPAEAAIDTRGVPKVIGHP